MAHDKIKAAARRRMAETGESYVAARREVIREFRAVSSSDPAGGPPVPAAWTRAWMHAMVNRAPGEGDVEPCVS
jgi:NADH:ubiquinone oxidoreductase subunit